MVMDNESTEEPITDFPKLKPSSTWLDFIYSMGVGHTSFENFKTNVVLNIMNTLFKPHYM